LNAQARNYFSLGEVENCWKCLEEVNVAFDNLGASDASSKLDYYGLIAAVRCRMGDWEHAWKIITTHLYDHITKTDIIPYFTMSGASFAIDALLYTLSNPTAWNNGTTFGTVKMTKSKLISKTEKLINAFNKTAITFPVSQPRGEQLKASLLALKGKNADKEFAKAFEKAKTFGMVYQQALCLYEKGILTNNSQSLVEAVEIFHDISSRGKDWQEIFKINKGKALKLLGDD